MQCILQLKTITRVHLYVMRGTAGELREDAGMSAGSLAIQTTGSGRQSHCALCLSNLCQALQSVARFH